MTLFQFRNHRMQLDGQFAPHQKEFVLRWNPEPCQPFSYRVDVLSGPAVNIVKHVLDLKLNFRTAVLRTSFQRRFVDHYPAQREQSADGWFTVMNGAKPILQKWTNSILTARNQVYNRAPRWREFSGGCPGDDCNSYCVEIPPEREENRAGPGGWQVGKRQQKKGRSNELPQPFRVSLFERFYARLKSDVINLCKRLF